MEMKKELAVKLFAAGQMTSSEAAELADIFIGEFIKLISERRIKFNLEKELVKESLESALKFIK